VRACCEQSLSSFFLVSRPHCTSGPQHWPSLVTHWESVDEWSRVPTGTVVEQLLVCVCRRETELGTKCWWM